MATIAFTSLLLPFTILSLFSLSSADSIGFSAELIHKDSPSSPLYNPSLTRYQRLANTLRRSQERAKYFASVLKNSNELAFSSEIIPNGGGFLMKMALGTPPLTTYGLIDTGSNIAWTQCEPCFTCYEQKYPLFDPKKSSTYKSIPCKSDTCLKVGNHECTFNGTCIYNIFYGGGSISRGLIASETLTLGAEKSQVSLPGIVFGCGHEQINYFSERESGIIGLGSGPTSLVTQLESSINGKFSYCLAPGFARIETHSQINFGTKATVSGPGVLTTPMEMRSGFYFLTLEALSVENDRVNLTDSSSLSGSNATRGNIFIDSGTTLTSLPRDTLETFVALVKKHMGNNTVRSPTKVFPLCYKTSDELKYPTIMAHFTGATIELKPINTFIEVIPSVTCLAFFDGGISILGNMAHTNFLVGYDTVQKSLSFKPSNCGHESQ